MIVRLFAATLVLYGHSFVFSANNGSKEFFSSVLHYQYAGDVGVNIFFVVSGFLIAASFCRRNSVIDFVFSRFIRIYPALFVFVLITTMIVGPMISTVPLLDYLTSKELKDYVFNTLTFWRYTSQLPIEFVGSSYPQTMAGVLWTIVIEVRLYVLIGILGAIGFLQNKSIANIVLAAIAISPLMVNTSSFLILANEANVRLSIFFIIGSLMYLNKDIIPLNSGALVVLVIATFLSNNELYFYLFSLTLIYTVFWFAFLPKIPVPSWMQDYSYGMYLYGWVIQQLVHVWFPALGPHGALMISLPATVAVAALSWYLIEKPALSMKRDRRSMAPIIN